MEFFAEEPDHGCGVDCCGEGYDPDMYSQPHDDDDEYSACEMAPYCSGVWDEDLKQCDCECCDICSKKRK